MTELSPTIARTIDVIAGVLVGKTEPEAEQLLDLIRRCVVGSEGTLAEADHVVHEIRTGVEAMLARGVGHE